MGIGAFFRAGKTRRVLPHENLYFDNVNLEHWIVVAGCECLCPWVYRVEVDTTFVSPYYFGPNAFPIPDVLTKTSDKLKIELAGDYYWGKNYTTDIFLKTHIPLWTHRANLSLWYS